MLFLIFDHLSFLVPDLCSTSSPSIQTLWDKHRILLLNWHLTISLAKNLIDLNGVTAPIARSWLRVVGERLFLCESQTIFSRSWSQRTATFAIIIFYIRYSRWRVFNRCQGAQFLVPISFIRCLVLPWLLNWLLPFPSSLRLFFLLLLLFINFEIMFFIFLIFFESICIKFLNFLLLFLRFDIHLILVLFMVRNIVLFRERIRLPIQLINCMLS